MRKQLPDQTRPFRLPAVYLLAYLGFLAANLIIYWSGWDIIWQLMVAVLIGYVILIIHEAVNHKKTPELEFRSGLWVIVWLAGLTIISWLGSYPKMSKHAGNQGIISVGWGIIILAIFSVLVTWMAVSLRLPVDKVKKHLHEPVGNEPLE